MDGIYPVRGLPNSTLYDRFGVRSLESRRIVHSVRVVVKLLRGSVECADFLALLEVNRPVLSLRHNRFFVMPAARTNMMLKSPLYKMGKYYNIVAKSIDICSEGLSAIETFVYDNILLFISPVIK